VIPFKNIPNALRVPLFFAEVDNSQANTAETIQRALVIGQITSSGTATVGVPVISQGVSDAKALGGPGSMLALMVAAYRAADPNGELWLLPLADANSSVAASGSINFTSPATANGVLSLYIAGVVVPVIITSSMTAANIATAVVAAIAANTDLPVTAAVDGSITSKVNITAKNAGLAGNDIQIQVNYYGPSNNEVTPAGLAYTIVAMASGATNPTLATPLASMATQSYDFIVNPYTDSANLLAVKNYLNDVSGTWSWGEQLYGHSFTAIRGTFSACYTITSAQNDQHNTMLAFNGSPTPTWIVAADLAATAAVSLKADPATPLQTLKLSTMLAPPLNQRYALTERNSLLYAGGSTFRVNDDGSVALENIITTYQKNGFNQPDNSYLEIETMYTLAAILRRLANVVTSRYARVKLAADGTRFAAGSNIVTPSIIKADIVAEYIAMENDGLVQGSSFFAKNIQVVQNASNPNRVDVLYPAVLIDQLRIFAVLAQFRLIVPA
jgi:phage tail sheath gpL-like